MSKKKSNNCMFNYFDYPVFWVSKSQPASNHPRRSPVQ